MESEAQVNQFGQTTQPITQQVANLWIVAFNTHDLSAMSALYAADAELYDSGMWSLRRGHREIEGWFRLRFGSMPGNVYAPERYTFLDEEHLAVDWRLYGRSPDLLGKKWLARPFEVNGTSYFVLRDGLIYKQYGRYDHLAVLRQILPWLSWLPSSFLQGIYRFYLLRHHQW